MRSIRTPIQIPSALGTDVWVILSIKPAHCRRIKSTLEQSYPLSWVFFEIIRGGKRYDFQIERGGNPNLAWIGAMNLKILLCFFTQIYQLCYPKREWNICLFIL